MSVATVQHRDSSIVLIYDPKDLTEIDLNRLRSGTPFDTIQYTAAPVPTMLLLSENELIRSTIQYTRLEYVMQVETSFEERSLEVFRQLLRALPELSVKAIGLNFTLFRPVETVGTAGQFIRDRFFKPQPDLERELGSENFGCSARMFFGAPSEYRDLRFTPQEVAAGVLVFQYHYHADEVAKDRDRIFRVVEERYKRELPHLTAALKLVQP